MADNQVTLEINVEAKDAQKAIDQFGASAVKSVKSAEKSFSSLSGSFTPIVAGVTAGIGAVVGAFKAFDRAIEESIQGAKELKQIKFSLQATGEASDEAVKSIVDFSNAVSESTGASSGSVKQLFVQAKTFGITSEQAKKLTQAALDLSAATGMDVDTALRQLGGTLDGSAGKINQLGTEFRNLSTEQLKSGDAIDLVTKKYGGAASAGLNTYEGASNSLSNALGDLYQNLGDVITQNEDLVKSIKLVAEAINYTASIIPKIAAPLKDYQKTLDDAKAKKFIDSIELVGNKSEAAAPKVKSLVEELSQTGGISSTKGFATFGESLQAIETTATKSLGLTGRAAEEARKKFDELKKSIVAAGEDEIQTADRVRKERLDILNQAKKDGIATEQEIATERTKILKDYEKVASKSYKDLSKSLETAGFDELQTAAKIAGDRFKIIDDALKKGLIAEAQAEIDREAILADYNKTYEKSIKEQLEMEKKKAEEISALQKQVKEDIQSISEDPTKYYGKEGSRAALNDKGSEAAVAAGIGAAKTITGGKQAAIKLSGTIANAIVPGLGPLIEVFAGGKDQVKALVKGFVEAIPDIIQGIIEGIPAIIEALVEILSNPAFYKNLIMAIVNGVKYFVTSILGSIVQAFNNLIPGFRDVIDGFGAKIGGFANDIGEKFGGFIRSIGDFFIGFGKALENLFKPFVQAIDALRSAFQPLTDAIASAADSIKGATGGKGGKGVIAETGGRISDAAKKYLSKGGVVYASGGFNPRGTDTIPAMLTPGEMVVPRDMVGQLGNFLDGGGKSDAILMAILNAVQQPVTVQSEVKVNQSAFADIMLQLNRQNARVVA